MNQDEKILWGAFAASLFLHFLLFRMPEMSMRFSPKKTIEIDITKMGHIGHAPAVQQKPPPAPPAPKPAAPPKEWVRPAENQKVEPAPIPTQPVAPSPPEPPAPVPPQASGPPGAPGEYAIGTGEGGEGQLTRLPQLLNLSDLAAIMQKFYPQAARSEGREAVVVLDIHISPEGQVAGADIVRSADPDFEDAARRVAKLLRFKPAFLGSQAVGVKMRQAIQFKLQR